MDVEEIVWKYDTTPSFLVALCETTLSPHGGEYFVGIFTTQRRFIWLKYWEGEGKELFSNL